MVVSPPPPWLAAAERQTLVRAFGGARPAHTVVLSYPRQVAVVFEFDHVVRCGACSAPSNAMLPRGRVVRVSYDRRSHRPTGAYAFCDVRGGRPPLASCLRR